MRYVADQQIEVFEVRSVLYELHNRMQRDKNDHLFEAMRRAEHSPTCEVCKLWDARMQGIRHAIRAFGGRPR
jgi:hypothetical protein